MHREDLFWMTPPMTEESLALTQPIGSRWPEPRLLWQTEEWLFASGVRIGLDEADLQVLNLVLDEILTSAYRLHQQAVDDESWLYASGAAVWWHRELGIPKTGDFSPETWVEATELVRWLRDRTF